MKFDFEQRQRLNEFEEAELESLRGSLDEWIADFKTLEVELTQLRTELDRAMALLGEITEFLSDNAGVFDGYGNSSDVGYFVGRARAMLAAREGWEDDR